MKIPIFEEINLKGITKENISERFAELFRETRIGKVPSYINLTGYNEDECTEIIIHLEKFVAEEGLHPRFPYPTYLITSKEIQSLFKTVRSVKDLPEHYFKKVKRPNNKELQLLNKLSLKVDKIKNLELYKIALMQKEAADMQKKLYQETKELYFLELIHHKLYEKTKR